MGALALLPLAWFESRRRPLAIACKEHHQPGRAWAWRYDVWRHGLATDGFAVYQHCDVAFLTAFYVPLVPLTAYLLLRRHVNFTVWPAVALSIFEVFCCLERRPSLHSLVIF